MRNIETMSKYEVFFRDLKKYLIDNKFQDKSDFNDCSIGEINNVLPKIPIAYQEWLKVFGNTSCLLNYPIEDYTLEELEFAQEEEIDEQKFNEENHKLLLISVFQDLHTYIIEDENNPTTFQINIGNPIFEEKLRMKGKFTTHIKSEIIRLINNENELDEWFTEDIIDYEKKPFKKKESYIELIDKIEELKEKENRIFTIPEIIKMWNN